MTMKNDRLSPTPSTGKRFAWGLAIIFMLLLSLLGAAGIPFWFESATIKYKFGLDKTLLRTGKIMGLTAGVLMLVQMFIGARIKFLDRIFTLNRLYGVHRINAVVIAGLAVLHPLLVFAPDDVTAIPVSLDFFPELIGFFLLLILWAMVGTGLFRLFLDLPFQRWRLAHRLAAASAGIALFAHILYVSDTFGSGVPLYAAITAAVLFAFLFIHSLIGPYAGKNKRYELIATSPAGRDAVGLALKPESGDVFRYLPGQFAFIRCFSKHVTSEEHPFTISSTPTRPEDIQFTVRRLGDWTGAVSLLQPGDKAVIDGPYGLFTCATAPADNELVFIAGGIGVTPMLSMLRCLNDVEDKRPVLLLWSNRTREDIVFPEEFSELETRMKNLKIVHILSRDPDYEGEKGRLDGARIRRLMADVSRDAWIYICGPPLMMRSVRRELAQIGFPRKHIVTEEFKL